MNEHLSRLATLIGDQPNRIIDPWKAAAAQLPRALHLDEPLLIDQLPKLLRELSAALIEAQSLSILEMTAHRSATEHGLQRFRLGFDVEEVVAEFNLLRDIIQQFAETSGVNISGKVNETINRVIDKAIAVSLETYVRHQDEENERRRREHLSFVVHDLKTPISAIMTATIVIEQNLSEQTPGPLINSMLDLLRRNATRLSDLVMEIINHESRMHALTVDSTKLQLNIREIDLWPVAERLKQDCQTIAESQQNTIRNDVPHGQRIHADPDLLVEVLQNLLSNALKYTNNGEIVIGAADGSNSAVFWVADSGIGIPPERINRIFEKGAADPNVPDSTGLGLAIVKKIVHVHGGEILVDSTPGSGSTFRITLPNTQTA